MTLSGRSGRSRRSAGAASILACLSAAAALLGAPAVLTSVPPTAAAGAGWAATPPIQPPRLNYTVTKLKNGLKVILLEDHRAPVATVQVWYHVGSKDEAPGKSGFAHLFEHLLFKGSENVGPEEHGKYIEQIGGDLNANTWFDRTMYYQTVPIGALDRVLFLEADRMASAKVDEANLKSEREVVKEEYRMRVENQPYGKLIENVQALIFPASHPYAHTTIGSIADLDSATLSEVRAFHEEYYKPDNATLVVVGDFKSAEALEKVRKYFEKIPRSKDGKFTRYPVVPDVKAAGPKRATWYDRAAPLPAIGMALRTPPASHKDMPALSIISRILSDGKSSRLYRSLVRDQQLAVEASGDALPLKLGGIFFFFAMANAGKDPATVEKALLAEVEKLMNEKVTEEELTKAKNGALNDQVFGMISTENKAEALGEADLLHGTPEEANRYIARLNAVTAADVQRVAREHFAPQRRNIFYMLPAAMQPKAQGANTTGAAAKEAK